MLSFSKQGLKQADAIPWHEALTLSSNENTNPFLKQTKTLLSTWGKKKQTLLTLCFKCCRKPGAVHHMVGEIYLLLPLRWTELPPGAITD